MIRQLVIKNFKSYQRAQIELQAGINILVGNNEAGKSTILEAVNLALTARIGRYPIMQALSPHVLNRSATKDYLKSLSSRHPQEPPEIVIELYFENSAITAPLKGTNNLLKEDSPGVRLWIHFDQDYASEYAELLKDPSKIRAVPIEYYKTEWLAFSGATITQRSMKVSASLIDASKMRLQSGADFYLQRIIQESLTDAERVRLARAYADLKESFAASEGIKAQNTELRQTQGRRHGQSVLASNGHLTHRRVGIKPRSTPRRPPIRPGGRRRTKHDESTPRPDPES